MVIYIKHALMVFKLLYFNYFVVLNLIKLFNSLSLSFILRFMKLVYQRNIQNLLNKVQRASVEQISNVLISETS